MWEPELTDVEPVLVWPVDLPTLITEIGDDPEDEAADDDVEIALAFKHGRDEKISSEVGLFRKLNVLRNPPATAGLLLLLLLLLLWLWLIRLFGLMLPFR